MIFNRVLHGEHFEFGTDNRIECLLERFGESAAVEGVELPTGEVMQPVNLLRNATTAEQAIARIDALQAQLDLAANDRLAERQGIVVAVLK